MERNNGTPVIDGGIVTAPPNTTAKHDFAETPQYGHNNIGSTASGLGDGRTTTAEQPSLGTSNNTSPATDTRPTSAKLKESASGVQGLAAAVHGTGEKLRGNINATVDRALGDKAGEAQNRVIAATGEREVASGQFSHETKNREGAIPGADGDRRKTRDPLSSHVA